MDVSRYRGTNRRCRVAMGGGRHVAMLAMLAAGGLGLAAPARADNPGYDRPGLGFTPAALGAGELTVEQGLPTWTRDRQDGQTTSQYTADSLLRLGLGDSLELQFGGSLYNRLREAGPGTGNRGQSALLWARRFGKSTLTPVSDPVSMEFSKDAERSDGC